MTEDTPHTAIEPEPAGFWLRGVAMTIDTMVFMLPFMVLFPLFAKAYAPVSMLASTALTVLLFFLLTLSAITYFVAMTSSSWQATLGKRIMGIYVTDRTGHRVSRKRAFSRYFVSIFVSALMILYQLPSFISAMTVMPPWLSEQEKAQYKALSMKDLKNGDLTTEEKIFLRSSFVPQAASTLSMEEKAKYNAARNKFVAQEKMSAEEVEIINSAALSPYQSDSKTTIIGLLVMLNMLYGLIISLSIAWSRSKRGIHDRICGTRALKGKPLAL